MARKMALVPAEFATHQNLQQHMPSGAILTQLSLLDQQMKSVLDDATTSPDVKLGKYYSTLRRYETLQDNAAQIPVPVRIQEKRLPIDPAAVEPTPLDQQELPVGEGEILEQVPHTQQRNAKLLLRYIKENPNIKWNRNKELVVEGSRVAGSNIFDLVSDMTRNRKNPTPATGWQEFTDTLLQQNIPEGAVGNKQRWQYIMNKRHDAPIALPILPGAQLTDEEDGYGTPTFTPSPSALRQQQKKQQKRNRKFSPLNAGTPTSRRNTRGKPTQFDTLFG